MGGMVAPMDVWWWAFGFLLMIMFWALLIWVLVRLARGGYSRLLIASDDEIVDRLFGTDTIAEHEAATHAAASSTRRRATTR